MSRKYKAKISKIFSDRKEYEQLYKLAWEIVKRNLIQDAEGIKNKEFKAELLDHVIEVDSFINNSKI